MIAFIPARAGSKRIPGKNLRALDFGVPLIAYTITAAIESQCFEAIYVCTDDARCAAIATHLGVAVIDRDPVPDDQADIVWVKAAIRRCAPWPEAFAILRPTSPFRTAAIIQDAVRQFQGRHEVDSLRALTRVSEHPGKMWTITKGQARPVIDQTIGLVPWHSAPTQTLPPYYKQTGGLELVWTRTIFDTGTISGTRILPFLIDGPAALDLNTDADWQRAEALATATPALLPRVDLARLSAVPQIS